MENEKKKCFFTGDIDTAITYLHKANRHLVDWLFFFLIDSHSSHFLFQIDWWNNKWHPNEAAITVRQRRGKFFLLLKFLSQS